MSARDAGFAMRDVTVTFGGLTALSERLAEARPHEVLGVIGPNGAGKTTLFNVACGFVVPTPARCPGAARSCTGSGRTTWPASASPAPSRGSGCSTS